MSICLEDVDDSLMTQIEHCLTCMADTVRQNHHLACSSSIEFFLFVVVVVTLDVEYKSANEDHLP